MTGIQVVATYCATPIATIIRPKIPIVNAVVGLTFCFLINFSAFSLVVISLSALQISFSHCSSFLVIIFVLGPLVFIPVLYSLKFFKNLSPSF
jgi:hypothetical protein